MDAGVLEYWIVDPEGVSIRVVRAGHADKVITDRLAWSPLGAQQSLIADLTQVSR